MYDSILEIFREETREHLAEMESLFLDLEATDDDAERRTLINGLFRHAHSLKGDVKVVGLDSLKVVVQALEDRLDELRRNPTEAGPEAVDRGLAGLDQVRQAFLAWDAKQGGFPAATKRPTSSAAPSTESSAASSGTAAADDAPNVEDRAEDAFRVRVPSEQLDELLNLAGELRVSRRSSAALTNRMQELRYHLNGHLKSFARLSNHENRQQIEIALDLLRRIDADLRKQVAHEDLLGESLEAGIRSARLLPFSMLTDSLRRAVRDLAKSLGKKIRFEVEGDVMLDKAVLGRLRDPLMHLVRNAADHGIEEADRRSAAGKAEEAVIRITASLQGSMVKLCVIDDGRGINFDSVREHVRRTGDLKESDVAELGPRELVGYLFQPGFSTAAAGEISGRGVGLDVVYDTVRRLQGTVELQSSSAAGTVFAITVPTIISSIHILTVVAAGQHFGVPLSMVARTGRARPEDLRELEGRPVLPVGDRAVRWVHLSGLVGAGEASKRTDESAWSYLLVNQPDRELAIVVDEMEDESEVLLKPLGFPLEGTPGILGAAVRPDGVVQLVLDLVDASWTQASARTAAAPSAPQSRRRILVADDSPTTRAILRNALTVAGYVVVTAKDGIDAMEQLRSRSVDLIVSDVDMPRLNGFDLTRRIKAKLGLPVILVTARENDEYRREGLAAGADAYLVKSTFEDQSLLEVVRQCIGS